MADAYEQNLAQKTDLTISDYVRVVGTDDNSYKQPMADVAQKIVEDYAGSTLAGSAQSVKSAIDGLKTSATTDKTELNASINEVASDLATETSTRTSQDANLQAQINQIVAPSGTAPNPAEIENARIGADNVTYSTLGDAIRTQVTDLKNDLGEITGVNEITGWTNGGYIYTGRSGGETVDISTIVSASAYQHIIIPCDANDELIISGLAGSAPRLWCFLDANNKVIMTSSANATADKLKLTIPLNTAKVVLNRNVSTVPCYIGKTPKSTSDEVTNFLDYYTDAKNTYMCNVLNKDTCIEGGYYNGNNVWVSNTGLYSSDYIPCKSGEIYSLNYAQDILLYDINKSFLGKIPTYATKTRRAFVVPTYERPVCFFRVYGVISQKETDGAYNTEEYIGDSRSIPYGNIYPVNPKTKNKIIHTFGGSRTWYDLNNYVEATTTPGELCIGYQSWMRRYLTTAVFNHGVSGDTTPQINTVVHNTNISNADVITLAGGINDFLHSTAIGTIQSIGGTFDTATVYGALQSMVEYILATKPDVKLMLINPFTGWLQNDAVEFPETYAKIKRDVAELYKLPLLDLTKICGFNSLNRDAFYCDDMTEVSYRLHLNNKGNAIIGQMISSFVSNGF